MVHYEQYFGFPRADDVMRKNFVEALLLVEGLDQTKKLLRHAGSSLFAKQLLDRKRLLAYHDEPAGETARGRSAPSSQSHEYHVDIAQSICSDILSLLETDSRSSHLLKRPFALANTFNLQIPSIPPPQRFLRADPGVSPDFTFVAG
jgi:hypothetical protein